MRAGGPDEPPAGLPRLAFKIRSGGFAWIKKRLQAEATLPTTRLGIALHRMARRGISAAAVVPRRMLRASGARFPSADQTVFGFYDLQVAPITFDFLWFLTALDLERRRRGLASVHIVIVPGPHDSVRRERDDYENVVDPEARRARIHNILIGATRLLPSCAGFTLAGSRAEAAFLRSVIAQHVFPADYEPTLPIYTGPHYCLDAARQGERPIAVLRSPAQELREMGRWAEIHAGDRRIVSITLRRYGYMVARNSNVPAWAAFARSLDPARYLPVFVPDTSDTIEGIPSELRPFATLPEAGWNVGLRMALYERAYLNLGINTGPMGLCWLNERTRYATLKMETPDVPQATRAYFRTLGFEPGLSLPFASALQEWVWEDDDEPAIMRAFERMIDRIEQAAITTVGPQ
jgi:hypothetical protein